MRITKRIENLFTSKWAKKLFLVILLILTIDILAAYLLAFFRPEGIWFLPNRSEASILSDLLFLEGATILAIGAIVVSGTSLWSSDASRVHVANQDHVEDRPHTDISDTHKKRLIRWKLIVIIGASLIGLSIVIGAVFH